MMEMRDKKQTVVYLPIDWWHGKNTPVNPPNTNDTMNPIVHSTGAVNRTRPPYIVNSQLNILTPVGTAMIMLVMPKNALTLHWRPS